MIDYKWCKRANCTFFLILEFLSSLSKTQKKVLKQSEKRRINNLQHSMKKKVIALSLVSSWLWFLFLLFGCVCIIALLFLVNGSKAFYCSKEKQKKIDFMVCDSCFAALLCVCLSFFGKKKICALFLLLLLLLFCRLPNIFLFLGISVNLILRIRCFTSHALIMFMMMMM